MTIWYRASKLKDIQSVFSGDGGLFTAGRWNYRGKKAIYCSQSISLCTLEWLAHNGLSVSGFDYYRYSINIPDNLIATFACNKLPTEWDATPSTDITRDFAEQELYLADKLAIAVPSVLVPEEFNLIINPLHKLFGPAFQSIEILGQHIAPSRMG